jgi:hypothetical protein
MNAADFFLIAMIFLIILPDLFRGFFPAFLYISVIYLLFRVKMNYCRWACFIFEHSESFLLCLANVTVAIRLLLQSWAYCLVFYLLSNHRRFSTEPKFKKNELKISNLEDPA